MFATTRQDGDGDEPGAEEHIEENGQDCEASDAAQEAGQERGEGGVDDGGAGDALDSLHPRGFMLVMFR